MGCSNIYMHWVSEEEREERGEGEGVAVIYIYTLVEYRGGEEGFCNRHTWLQRRGGGFICRREVGRGLQQYVYNLGYSEGEGEGGGQ